MPSGYYPMGAENDTRAPYNEEEIPMRDFPCRVDVTLQKDVSISTDSYIMDGDDVDTLGVDWEEEYVSNSITIDELLRELESYIEDDLAASGCSARRRVRLRRLLDACRGWAVTETFVEEL